MTAADQGRGTWLTYCAALWALIFAGLHIFWAAGRYIGLPTEQARKTFGQPWFVAYDLVVATVCMLAVPVALALVRPLGRRVPRWLIGLLAWGGTALLVLRSVGSVIQVLYQIVKGTFVPHLILLWEVWFYVGAVLFGLSTWRFWTAQPRSSVAA